jgi:hypothetical protein
MNKMSKENFWNDIESRWAGGFEFFKQWIDDYKKEVGWEKLFGTQIKYHDLPEAMQIGIFLQYTIEANGTRYHFEILEDDTIDNILDNIKEWFCVGEDNARWEHQQEKYDDNNTFDLN